MDSNLDIVFLGGLFPKETEDEILQNSKGSIQNAANNLQWEIVKGLDANIGSPIQILNSVYIGSYPKRYKKLLVNTYKFAHNLNDSMDTNVGFVNLPGIKNISRYFSLKPYLKKWALAQGDKKKIVIAYAMTSTFTHLLRYVKEVNDNISTCLIVPDLPQYMNLSRNKKKLYTVLKDIDMKCIYSDMKYIDKYVLLTKSMGDYLGIAKDYTVVEGIASDIFDEISSCEKSENEKIVLYSGTLNEKYGVMNLLRAFKQISDDNYKLIICGVGDCEKEIATESKIDKRIIFKGQIKREEVLKLQKEATVLINPRQNNEEYTKYSFPSKILEYLSSGTPVIAYKLDGIPNEYDKFIYYVEDNSIDALKNKIIQVCSKNKDELSLFGKGSKEFVLKEKNKIKQTEKIINLINL